MSEITEPVGWPCKCGNILGIMYRDGNAALVLDTFRGRVTKGEFSMFVAMAIQKHYGVRQLVCGKVICPKCGRSMKWDSSKRNSRRASDV